MIGVFNHGTQGTARESNCPLCPTMSYRNCIRLPNYLIVCDCLICVANPYFPMWSQIYDCNIVAESGAIIDNNVVARFDQGLNNLIWQQCFSTVHHVIKICDICCIYGFRALMVMFVRLCVLLWDVSLWRGHDNTWMISGRRSQCHLALASVWGTLCSGRLLRRHMYT